MSGTLWDATTFTGLVAILEDSRVPVAQGCRAVEECLAINRYVV